MKISWVQTAKLAIGETAYNQLCEELGGRTIFIPDVCTPNHYITAVIGIEKANALCDACAGIQILLPISLSKKKKVSEAINEGLKTHQIAANFYVSRRYVEKIRAELLNAKQAELQSSLF